VKRLIAKEKLCTIGVFLKLTSIRKNNVSKDKKLQKKDFLFISFIAIIIR
jgi:hypothetical protein